MMLEHTFRKVLAAIVVAAALNGLCLQATLCQAYSSPSSFTIINNKGERFTGAFTSIQQAINDAENGSTVFVSSGTYFEHVVINKTISVVGQNISTTIIDGSNSSTVVQVLADNVSISGFTIRYSGWGWTNNGVYVHYADNCEIRDNYFFVNCHNIRLNYSRGSRVIGNVIDGNGYGIRLLQSENCVAVNNTVTHCIGGIHLEYATSCNVSGNCLSQNDQGIRFYSPCTYNRIYENTVFNSTYDGMIEAMPGNSTIADNIFFHNNFINNTNQFIYKVSNTTWDDGYPSGGNYWSRYNGTDLHTGPSQNLTGNDGIGDAQYSVSQNSYDKDRYPLMHPYGSVQNLNTNLTYLSIQSAIDATETLDEHTILVRSGTYAEHLVVSKTLSIVGDNRETTFIDGGGSGTVLTVKADNVTVVNFCIRNSGTSFPPYGNDCGLLLDHCRGGNVSYNQIMNNRIGLYLLFSTGNFVENNTVSSNLENGVYLWFSGNNTLAGNRIADNAYNFGVFGDGFQDFDNTIDITNIVNGKPVFYVVGAGNIVLDNTVDVGAVYFISCSNVTVRNLNLTRNGHCVFGYNVTQARIENVTASDSSYGIYLQESTNNSVSSSRCSSNWVGICLQDSYHNVVEGNVVVEGEKGISLYKASNNSVEGNSIQSASYGIRFFSSNFNEVVHNNLVNNTEQASLISSYQNFWDDGFEGNFWSDYNGSDMNRDGIGDDHYVIDYENHDGYPLMGAFLSFDVSYEGSFSQVTVVTNSTVESFAFETSNHTIRLKISGPDGTFGFCRTSVPHALVQGEIIVIIDDGLSKVFFSNYSLHDDGVNRWIYFTYKQSTHKIMIAPSRGNASFAVGGVSYEQSTDEIGITAKTGISVFLSVSVFAVSSFLAGRRRKAKLKAGYLEN